MPSPKDCHTVYSYMRFSTSEQKKGHSLARQTDYAKAYADKHNLILDESLTMRDEGLSAYHQKHISHGTLGVFYRAIEQGIIKPGSVLIVESLDRLSRAKPLDALPHFLNIIKSGITVVIAKDGKSYSQESIDKNPFQLFESLVEMVRANKESEYKSDRIKSAIIARINHWIEHGQGRVLTIGGDPYWVKVKKNKSGFDLIPERASVICEIVAKYFKGWGIIKIIDFLNENHKPFGKKWNISFVYKLLRNRALIGERYFNIGGKTYIINKYYPPVLDETEFAILQNEVKNRAITKAQQKIPSIITGSRICFCGHCNRSIISQNRKQRTYKGKVYDRTPGLNRLFCSSKIHGPKCLTYTGTPNGVTSIQSAPVERALLEYCADNMELASIFDDNTDAKMTIKAKICDLQAKFDKAEKVIKNGNNAMINLLVQGEDVSAINNVIKQQESNLKDYQIKISALEDELRIHSAEKNFGILERWSQIKTDIYNMDEEARLLIRQVVKRTFKRIEIYFHSFNKSKTGKLLQANINDLSIVMILTFVNDKTRMLVIDRKSGSWTKGGDLNLNIEAKELACLGLDSARLDAELSV